MSELHRIEDDMGEGWLDLLVEEGLRQIEALLTKHAAFLEYLGEGA